MKDAGPFCQLWILQLFMERHRFNSQIYTTKNKGLAHFVVGQSSSVWSYLHDMSMMSHVITQLVSHLPPMEDTTRIQLPGFGLPVNYYKRHEWDAFPNSLEPFRSNQDHTM